MAPTCIRLIFAAGLLGLICGYRRFSAGHCYFLQDDPFDLLNQSLSVGFSLRLRVKLVKWKSTFLNNFAVFILLCGDVAQNPGPNSNELCGFCKTAVIDTDPAVCCDV